MSVSRDQMNQSQCSMGDGEIVNSHVKVIQGVIRKFMAEIIFV